MMKKLGHESNGRNRAKYSEIKLFQSLSNTNCINNIHSIL